MSNDNYENLLSDLQKTAAYNVKLIDEIHSLENTFMYCKNYQLEELFVGIILAEVVILNIRQLCVHEMEARNKDQRKMEKGNDESIYVKALRLIIDWKT